MRKGLWKKILAAVLAIWMAAAAAPAVAAVSEDWTQLQISVQWPEGEDMVQTAMAVPVEGTEGAFWLYVPAEVLGNLTLQLYHPAHSYIFFPESGSPLTGLTDAGLTMDSPGFPINAQDPDTEAIYTFTLFVSTQAMMPVAMEQPTEESTPEPTEVPTPEPTEVPTPEPTEVPTPVPTVIPAWEPVEEPAPRQKRHFDFEEFNWDLSGFPTERRKKTEDINFSWESVTEDRRARRTRQERPTTG